MTKSPYLNFVLKSFLRFLAITPFNIFLIVMPGLITFALIVLMWAITLTLFAASFAAPVVAIQTELFSLSFWSGAATVSTSLFSFFASVFLGIIIFFITKHFVLYMFNYVVWNYKFIFKSSKTI